MKATTLKRNAARGVVFVVALAAAGCAATVAQGVRPTPAGDVDLALLRKSYDWQIAQLTTPKPGEAGSPVGWIRVPLYEGAVAMYDATGDAHYLEAVTAVAEKAGWDLGYRPRKRSGLPGAGKLKGDAAAERYDRHADDLAIGQTYAALYARKKDEQRIAPLRQRLDAILAAEPLPGRDEWWWCDALYMAPPAFARLSAVTGDRKYLDYADRQFWDNAALLYSPDRHLFFRDRAMMKRQSPNGLPLFWSRGNGWVIAGLANVLAAMPADYPSRPKYEMLFKTMAAELATLQKPDGFWPVSLLDPDAYDGHETSGTGFYCFAMAWGINHGLLDREKYLPVVRRAWAGLRTVIDPATGRVGWVQPVAASPGAVKATDTAPYGTGALLLAGTEVLKLK